MAQESGACISIAVLRPSQVPPPAARVGGSVWNGPQLVNPPSWKLPEYIDGVALGTERTITLDSIKGQPCHCGNGSGSGTGIGIGSCPFQTQREAVTRNSLTYQRVKDFVNSPSKERSWSVFTMSRGRVGIRGFMRRRVE